jgi:hypothetical protein
MDPDLDPDPDPHQKTKSHGSATLDKLQANNENRQNTMSFCAKSLDLNTWLMITGVNLEFSETLNGLKLQRKLLEQWSPRKLWTWLLNKLINTNLFVSLRLERKPIFFSFPLKKGNPVNRRTEKLCKSKGCGCAWNKWNPVQHKIVKTLEFQPCFLEN